MHFPAGAGLALLLFPGNDLTAGLLPGRKTALEVAGSLEAEAPGYGAGQRRSPTRLAVEDKTLVFLTNNFSLPALTIAELYRCRWQVERFFKWIKQHLRIKSFFGTSENAVKTQIWIAISVYVQVAIIKKRLRLDASLYTILQILSVTIFETMPLNKALSVGDYTLEQSKPPNQLILFE